MLLLVALAAADPVRCTVAWTTPVAGCQVRGPLRVDATANAEKGARADAADALAEVLALAGTAARLRAPALAVADFESCRDAAARVVATCFPEPTLVGTRLCFADLAAPECWDGDVLHYEIAGVRALEEGRERMCAAVDARLVALAYTDTELRRASCRVRCEAETRVRCPAD